MKRSVGAGTSTGTGMSTRTRSPERNDDGDNHKRCRLSNLTSNKKSLNSTPHDITSRRSIGTAKTHTSQMMQRETDERKLAQRQKQIDFGKNTIGYDRYLQSVPKTSRQFGVHPSTPDKYAVASKRAWDGRIQAWRRHLHLYDPEATTPAPRSASSAPPMTAVPSHDTATTRQSESALPRATSSQAPAPRTVQASLFDAFDDDTKAPSEIVDEDDLL
ncbi:hypothetical protein H310_00311, partial [Aphanomyces invadans]